MSFEDGLPPAYDEVVGRPGGGTGAIPSAPPIAVPILDVIQAPIGFDSVHQPTQAALNKEQEAGAGGPHTGYGATNQPGIGPGFDPEDDRPAARVAPATATSPAQRGKREFVIRFTCPSCDCSNLVPHCENLTCCTPDIGCFNRLHYLDTKKEREFFANVTWSKLTDRHLLHFYRKPENIDDFAKFLNGLIFFVFLVCTTAMFLVSPWAAIFIAIFYECDDPALRPLLASYGAVALAEAFQRTSCYILHKLDRPKRAIKSLESPNALWVPLLVLLIVIATRIPDLTYCSNNSMALLPPNSSNLSNLTVPIIKCCDEILIKTSIIIPAAWVAFEIIVILLVAAKLIFEF